MSTRVGMKQEKEQVKKPAPAPAEEAPKTVNKRPRRKKTEE